MAHFLLALLATDQRWLNCCVLSKSKITFILKFLFRFQVYTSNHTAKAFARLTEIYSKLAPYHAFVVDENSRYGYPAQRPLFFHYPDDPKAYEIQYQYLYGPGKSQIF